MKNFNLVNVLDTELTCWPEGICPPGEKQEVIEYGLTEVDLRALTIARTISIPVIPVMSSVSVYCTELTGWTMAKLRKSGVQNAEACRRLSRLGRSRLLVTDSNGDVTGIRAQCALQGIEYPFGEDNFNVSTLFTLVTGARQNLSLSDKLAHLGLKFEGVEHRAGNDSLNIARLLIELVRISRTALPQFGLSE